MRKLKRNFQGMLIDKNGKEFGRVVGEINFINKDFIELLKQYI